MRVGTASAVLVFAVLCLAVFAIISLVPALNEQKLIESEVRLVAAFYEADALAERMVAEILADSTAHGKEVHFTCEISFTMELYVHISSAVDSHEILAWRMVNRANWNAPTRLPVWQGGMHDYS